MIKEQEEGMSAIIAIVCPYCGYIDILKVKSFQYSERMIARCWNMRCNNTFAIKDNYMVDRNKLEKDLMSRMLIDEEELEKHSYQEKWKKVEIGVM